MSSGVQAPLISVIVPVFNVESYLKRCIDSVLTQTYSAWELILVDDGSCDDSGKISDAYSSRHTRVHVIHQQNAGLSGARNTGLEAAHGAYVAFLDADDWWHQDFLSHLLGLIWVTGADVAACRLLRTREVVADLPLVETYDLWDQDTALARLFQAHRTTLVVACAKIYRRELFDDIRFPIGRVHEDEFTAHRVLAKANSVVLSDAVAYYYWQRADSITGARPSPRSQRDALEAAQEQAAALRTRGDPALAQAATLYLLRRLIHHLRWALAHRHRQEAAVARGELANLLTELRGQRSARAARLLGHGYLHVPRLAAALHSTYLGVCGARRRRFGNTRRFTQSATE